MMNLTASWHLPGSPAPCPPACPPYRGYSATWTPVQFSLLSEVMAKYSELWGQSQVSSDPIISLGHPPMETDEG